MVDEPNDDEQFGYGFDDEPDEPGLESIDADLKNADWPKRTDDRIDPLDRENATPFIRGPGWFIWFDYDSMDWESDTEESPIKMIRAEFPGSEIDQEQTRIALYEKAIAFFDTWGIKASIVS